MQIIRNPNDEELRNIIHLSRDKAAKWIEDPADKARYFWPSDQAFHARVAAMLNIEKYDKGIAIGNVDS